MFAGLNVKHAIKTHSGIVYTFDQSMSFIAGDLEVSRFKCSTTAVEAHLSCTLMYRPHMATHKFPRRLSIYHNRGNSSANAEIPRDTCCMTFLDVKSVNFVAVFICNESAALFLNSKDAF